MFGISSWIVSFFGHPATRNRNLETSFVTPKRSLSNNKGRHNMAQFNIAGTALVLALAIGCSGITTIGPVKTVTTKELKQNSEQLAQALQGDGMVVHLTAGESIALELAAELPFAELEPGDNQISFTRDVYLFISKEGVMLSPDGVSFAPLHKMKSLKKLFGADKGSFRVGFKVSKEDGAAVSMAASMK
jgi:hypothetical protein